MMQIHEIEYNIEYWRKQGSIGTIVPFDTLEALIEIAKAALALPEPLHQSPTSSYKHCLACGEEVLADVLSVSEWVRLEHDPECPWMKIQELEKELNHV